MQRVLQGYNNDGAAPAGSMPTTQERVIGHVTFMFLTRRGEARPRRRSQNAIQPPTDTVAAQHRRAGSKPATPSRKHGRRPWRRARAKRLAGRRIAGGTRPRKLYGAPRRSEHKHVGASRPPAVGHMPSPRKGAVSARGDAGTSGVFQSSVLVSDGHDAPTDSVRARRHPLEPY
jgi:hypothetical protein